MIQRPFQPVEPIGEQVPTEGAAPILETIETREMDFTFTGPTVFSLTLEPDDTLQKFQDGSMVIKLARNGETITINPIPLMYWSERPRTIQRKVKPHAK